MKKIIITSKTALFLYYLTVLINILHIYLKVIKSDNILVEICIILMALFLIKTISFYENRIVNLCSLFVLYPSIMSLINTIHPLSFWGGFVVFIPEFLGIIWLLILFLRQISKKV